MDPYDNTVWIDSSYWFWTWAGLVVALKVMGLIVNKDVPLGPADSMAETFGICFGAMILMVIALYVTHLFGIDIGMRG